MRQAAFAFAVLVWGCAPPRDPSVVTGTVRAGGQPIAGARVRFQAVPDLPGQPGFVTTDGGGRFVLPTRASERTLGHPRTVAAGHAGWKNGGSLAYPGDEVEIDLAPIPPGRDPRYRLSNGLTGDFPCFLCHGQTGDEWSRSMHGQAATDPLVHREMERFFAWDARGRDLGVRFTDGDGQTQYTVGADRTTRDECAQCHAPALVVAGGGADFRPIALDPGGDRAVREGVGCDVCHKMRAPITGDATRPGLELADLRFPVPATADQVVFGPFDDSTFSETQAAYAPEFATGDGCAPCHTNARVLTLEQTGGATVQRRIWGEDTWREWRFDPATVRAVDTDGDPPASGEGPYPAGRSYAGRPLHCQDCHMRDPPPDPATGEIIADHRPAGDDWQRVAQHGDAPLRHPETLSPHRFEGVSPRMLAWATELRVTAAREGAEISVSVELENRHTGHAFPSGLPDRNVVLLVGAQGATGPLAQTAGPLVPAWATFDGRATAGRLYARHLASAAGDAPVFYAFAVRDGGPDTRLRPGEIDRQVFRFAVAGAQGSIEVRASVLHRRRFPAQLDGKMEETPGDQALVRIP